MNMDPEVVLTKEKPPDTDGAEAVTVQEIVDEIVRRSGESSEVTNSSTNSTADDAGTSTCSRPNNSRRMSRSGKTIRAVPPNDMKPINHIGMNGISLEVKKEIVDEYMTPKNKPKGKGMQDVPNAENDKTNTMTDLPPDSQVIDVSTLDFNPKVRVKRISRIVGKKTNVKLHEELCNLLTEKEGPALDSELKSEWFLKAKPADDEPTSISKEVPEVRSEPDLPDQSSSNCMKTIPPAKPKSKASNNNNNNQAIPKPRKTSLSSGEALVKELNTVNESIQIDGKPKSRYGRVIKPKKLHEDFIDLALYAHTVPGPKFEESVTHNQINHSDGTSSGGKPKKILSKLSSTNRNNKGISKTTTGDAKSMDVEMEDRKMETNKKTNKDKASDNANILQNNHSLQLQGVENEEVRTLEIEMTAPPPTIDDDDSDDVEMPILTKYDTVPCESEDMIEEELQIVNSTPATVPHNHVNVNNGEPRNSTKKKKLKGKKQGVLEKAEPGPEPELSTKKRKQAEQSPVSVETKKIKSEPEIVPEEKKLKHDGPEVGKVKVTAVTASKGKKKKLSKKARKLKHATSASSKIVSKRESEEHTEKVPEHQQCEKSSEKFSPPEPNEPVQEATTNAAPEIESTQLISENSTAVPATDSIPNKSHLDSTNSTEVSPRKVPSLKIQLGGVNRDQYKILPSSNSEENVAALEPAAEDQMQLNNGDRDGAELNHNDNKTHRKSKHGKKKRAFRLRHRHKVKSHKKQKKKTHSVNFLLLKKCHVSLRHVQLNKVIGASSTSDKICLNENDGAVTNKEAACEDRVSVVLEKCDLPSTSSTVDFADNKKNEVKEVSSAAGELSTTDTPEFDTSISLGEEQHTLPQTQKKSPTRRASFPSARVRLRRLSSRTVALSKLKHANFDNFKQDSTKSEQKQNRNAQLQPKVGRISRMKSNQGKSQERKVSVPFEKKSQNRQKVGPTVSSSSSTTVNGTWPSGTIVKPHGLVYDGLKPLEPVVCLDKTLIKDNIYLVSKEGGPIKLMLFDGLIFQPIFHEYFASALTNTTNNSA